MYPAVLEELLPAAWHRTDRYANYRVECDHGRLKSRLRPMRGLSKTAAPAGEEPALGRQPWPGPIDPRELLVFAEPCRQAGCGSRHPQQRHPRVAVLAAVLA